jgi:nucleotide-binding universal stress UspA family protein
MPRSFQRIVVAIDGSALASEVVAVAAALDWLPDATTIWVTSVVDLFIPSLVNPSPLKVSDGVEWQRVLGMAHAEAGEKAAGIVAEAASMLRTHHPRVTVEEIVRIGEPAAKLLAQITEVGADFVIAGARGRTGLRGLLLGSVSEELVMSAPCPVLIVRNPPGTLETVLVAVRTPEDADRLAEVCLQLPLPARTRFDVATVSVPQLHIRDGHHPFAEGRFEAMLREMAEDDRAAAQAVGQRFVSRIHAEAPERPVTPQVLRGVLNPTLLEEQSDIAPTLLHHAERVDASLIVVGAREHRGVACWFGLGSVSRKLVRRAPCSVLVVRGPTT